MGLDQVAEAGPAGFRDDFRELVVDPVRVIGLGEAEALGDPGDVRVGGIPVPAPLVGWVFRNFDPSARLGDRLPVPVEMGAVRVAADAIRIAD